jgi:hypothetical protein
MIKNAHKKTLACAVNSPYNIRLLALNAHNYIHTLFFCIISISGNKVCIGRVVRFMRKALCSTVYKAHNIVKKFCAFYI